MEIGNQLHGASISTIEFFCWAEQTVFFLWNNIIFPRYFIAL